MSRSVAWRRQQSDYTSYHQDEALEATIYILRETGPTGFLLKEEGDSKKYRVYLGDPHSCTCQTFMKEHDLCKHICWVLLKKFRVPRQNELTWQMGLVEREVNQILRGSASKEVKPSATAKRLAKQAGGAAAEDEENEQEQEGIKQRPIAEDDVCPICQEEFFAKHLPVTYCKFGCGNNIHIKCMKVWADHQKTMTETNIKCPLCREDFGPLSLLQEEMRNSSTRATKAERLGQHLGATCKQCRTAPIVGKCYKCTVCAEYHLCQNCFITPVHEGHNFEYRERPNQRWKSAPRNTGSSLPPAVVNAMMTRDLGDADYETLLQLDNQAATAASSLSEDVVRLLPTERIRKKGLLLAPGQQCRVCLQQYSEGQFVRKLPCKHKFHKECIDNWLIHQHATCPIDGTVFSNDSVRAYKEVQRIRQQQRQGISDTGNNNQQPNGGLQLEIPGIGIAAHGLNPRGPGSLRSGQLARGGTVVPNAASILISGTRYGEAPSIDNYADAIDSVEMASRLESMNITPTVPVPPSIPRLHEGLNMGIGRPQPPDSPQNRPPSGNQRERTNGGSASSVRGRSGRVRGRITQSSATRQRNNSGNRAQSLERRASNPSLYLGHSEGELITTESGGNSRDRPSSREHRKNSLSNHAPSPLANRHVGPDSPSHERIAQQLLVTLRTGRRQRDPPEQPQSTGMVHAEGPDDLYLGSGSLGSPLHGSPTTRPRHGLTGLGALGTLGSANRELTHPRNHLGSLPDGRQSGGGSDSSLYIGADPASSEGFLKQFLLNSIAQKAAAKSRTSRETSADSNRRWGEVREMSGQANTMVLSGNRVQSQDPS